MHGKRRPPCGNGGPRGVAAGCGSDLGSQDRQMMMMNNIQASASAILQTANLLPSDSIRIKKSSFAGSEKIAEKVNATMGNIKILDGKLFNTSGRLKGGNEAVHNVFETQFGRITILKNKLNDLIAELKEKKKNAPVSSRLPLIGPIQESANRNRTEGRQQWPKITRYVVNCRQLIKTKFCTQPQ